MRRLLFLLISLLTLLCACTAPVKKASPAPAPAQEATRPTKTNRSAVLTTDRDPASGLRWVAISQLPREAGPVLDRIVQGGPFRSARDGVTFANRERILPRAASGTYREYTVPTPGSSDRGARRIVCAGARHSTAECYYTADHYATFRRLRP